ncbi:hypothetical protein GCM10020220_093890 [Nonomuraea rubra]
MDPARDHEQLPILELAAVTDCALRLTYTRVCAATKNEKCSKHDGTRRVRGDEGLVKSFGDVTRAPGSTLTVARREIVACSAGPGPASPRCCGPHLNGLTSARRRAGPRARRRSIATVKGSRAAGAAAAGLAVVFQQSTIVGRADR